MRLVSQHLSLIFIARRKGSFVWEALDRTWRKLLLLLNLSFVAGVSSSGRYAIKIGNPLKRSFVDEVYLRICRFDAQRHISIIRLHRLVLGIKLNEQFRSFRPHLSERSAVSFLIVLLSEGTLVFLVRFEGFDDVGHVVGVQRSVDALSLSNRLGVLHQV